MRFSHPCCAYPRLLVGAAALACAVNALLAQSPLGTIAGVVKDQAKAPITGALVTATNTLDQTTASATSGPDGSYLISDLKPGKYSVVAQLKGFSNLTLAALQVDAGGTVHADVVMITAAPTPTASGNAVHKGFFGRFAQAYMDDWHPPAGPPAPDPPFRGFPAPVTNPPYPFTVWPYGGSVVIGQPYTSAPPLMTALYAGPNGEWWKKSKLQFYGWANVGMNISSSHDGVYANAPAAYAQIANSIQPDQMTLYIERQPDTVQREHFDWGFRLTGLWGFDYRFTTAKGIFSQQLLTPQRDGTLGQKYGFDPVMAYVDLYFPKVAEGLNVRIGRYISLPDIEAQLAPNNYTYSHSLTYTYDCYTQEGVNATFMLSKHWLWQVGLSAGCDAAPWTKDAKVTGNTCLGYYWHEGGDNFYVCANSLNDSKYAYNNLAAYYATWYHKFNNRWHTDTEAWYQYQRQVPNVNNPDAASMIEPNANGAYCNHAYELTCFAPEWAIVNYVNRQFGKKDFISIRNEYMDDIRGQRTGFKTRYSEHMISYNHWVGTTIVLRPELRYDHAYDAPAFDSGNKKGQLMFAGDIIFFY